MRTAFQDRIRALLDLDAPLPKSPVVTPRPERPKACRCGDIDCMACWDAGVRYADYEKQKRLEEL